MEKTYGGKFLQLSRHFKIAPASPPRDPKINNEKSVMTDDGKNPPKSIKLQRTLGMVPINNLWSEVMRAAYHPDAKPGIIEMHKRSTTIRRAMYLSGHGNNDWGLAQDSQILYQPRSSAQINMNTSIPTMIAEKWRRSIRFIKFSCRDNNSYNPPPILIHQSPLLNEKEFFSILLTY